MDILQECAIAFEKLFRTDYVITAGHRGKLLKITIVFQAEQFYHLVGLQKLIDLPQVGRAKNKSSLFRNIKIGKLTYDTIKSSIHIEEVNQRIKYFHRIENLLNCNIIIKFDKRKAHTSINAEVLIYERYEEGYIQLFFQSMKHDILAPCSFFTTNGTKYIERQETYKVLNIEKIERFPIKQEGK